MVLPADTLAAMVSGHMDVWCSSHLHSKTICRGAEIKFKIAINANQLYSSKDFFWTYRNNSIFITVNIPLLTQAVILDVFKVLSVPVPLHRGSPHVPQLLDIPRYMSFSADGVYYTSPDPDKWLTCGKH